MILFINACVREDSRTKKLADCLLEDKSSDIQEVDLADIEIPDLTEEAITSRLQAAMSGDTTDPFVALARDFSKATVIVIAAPYWDLSFPAILKKYIEAIMVTGITFEYDENGAPMGLCCADTLYYITTSGGKIHSPDFGFSYIKTLAKDFWGINNVICYSAEGLDIDGANPDVIMGRAMRSIRTSMGIYGMTKNVLVVDDSKINILKAEHILKEHGYNTIAASSGEACLKMLKMNTIDIILLDIEMPEMNGFEVLDAIRANPEWAHIPVIFVTSDKSMDVVLKASQTSISGYVVKPFSEDELMSKLYAL